MQNNVEGMMQNDTLVSKDNSTSGVAAAFSESERVYAGFFVRLAAYLIDWIIVGAALLVIKIPIWISWIMNGTGVLTQDFIFKYSIYDIVIYVLKVIYFVLLTYYSGATLGKKLMNLQVISEEDRKPTFFEIVYRESVGKFLSGLIMSIGYIIIGLDKKKRGLHDQLADTCVVYCHKKTVYMAAPVMTQTKPFISTQFSGQNVQNSGMQNSGMQNSGMQSEYQNYEMYGTGGERRVPYQQRDSAVKEDSGSPGPAESGNDEN